MAEVFDVSRDSLCLHLLQWRPSVNSSVVSARHHPWFSLLVTLLNKTSADQRQAAHISQTGSNAVASPQPDSRVHVSPFKKLTIVIAKWP